MPEKSSPSSDTRSVESFIEMCIRKTLAKNGGTFKKIDADTAENVNWLRQHRKNTPAPDNLPPGKTESVSNTDE